MSASGQRPGAERGLPPRPAPRLLVLVCAGLAVAAGLLWAGSATVWYRVVPVDGGPVELTGAQAAPWLGGLALLALAGVAGVVATGGVLRRSVGGLLAVAGAAVLVAGVAAQFTAPSGDLPTEVTAAPLWVVVGAVVLLVSGGLVLARERRLPRLGARYAAPGEQRPERDPDRAAWQELDAGRDPTAEPTADPPRSPRDEPGDGPRNADV